MPYQRRCTNLEAKRPTNRTDWQVVKRFIVGGSAARCRRELQGHFLLTFLGPVKKGRRLRDETRELELSIDFNM